jgi:hypothetical protein
MTMFTHWSLPDLILVKEAYEAQLLLINSCIDVAEESKLGHKDLTKKAERCQQIIPVLMKHIEDYK